MPFEQYQQSLRQADNAAENRVNDISNDINRLKENSNELKAELKTKNQAEPEAIEELNAELQQQQGQLQQKKEQLQEIIYIWKVIRYPLNRFGFVKKDAEQSAVWKAHNQVSTNYVKLLYQSLKGQLKPLEVKDEKKDFLRFLKKVGLTDALLPRKLSNRLFHVVQRMAIDELEEPAQRRFPIHDDADGKQAFETLNKAVVNWVSEVLGSQEFPADLPTWTDRRFQVYLGYEALYIYLCSIDEKLANNIDPFNFYDGLRDWLKHPPGTSKEGKKKKRDKINATELSDCQWTQVLDKALDNPITYLAMFSKAVHLLVFVGNENKAEEANTRNPEKIKPFLGTLGNERKHLEPEDDEDVLEKVSEGMKAFEKYANQAKPEELGESKKGAIPNQWCDSSLCRFLGLKFCKDIYAIAPKVFPQDQELPKTVRDILVKPLGSDSKEHNRILGLLECGRQNAKVVNDIMTLVDKATFPVFREIWEILDAQPLEDDESGVQGEPCTKNCVVIKM